METTDSTISKTPLLQGLADPESTDSETQSSPAIPPSDIEDSASYSAIGPGAFPGIRKPLKSLWWLIQVLLGVGFLLPLMAGFAAIPGVSLLSLGFMLDAEAQVGKSGKLRDGFPLLEVSTRVGTICLMVLLFLLPIFAASSVAEGQETIAQLSQVPQNSRRVLTVIIQVVAFCFLALAIANGGSIGRFFWALDTPLTLKRGIGMALGGLIAAGIAANAPPVLALYLLAFLIWECKVVWRNLRDLRAGFRDGSYVQAVNLWTDRLLEVFRPWYHFKVAIRGAVGAICWLAIPTALLGAASTTPHAEPGPAVALSLLGGILLIPVAAWLPLLQCHQAANERFSAIFDVRVAREIICRVPIRWGVATILLYGLAVPLYLSKVVLPPADAYWLFTPLFIIVIYPTRILMGWVYGAGMQKDVRAARLIRWPTKVFMIPLLGLYSLILFLVPMTSAAGPRAMFENHAFLLPVPSGQFEQ